MSSLPDSIGVVLPPEWVEVGVDRASFDERWAAMKEEFRAGPNWSRTAERHLEAFMMRIRLMIQEQRVVFCASLLVSRQVERDASRGEAGDGDPDPLMASCVMSVLTRAELGSDLMLSPEAVLAAYSQPPRDGGDEGHELTNLEPPAIVSLASAGEAVQLIRLAEIRTEPGKVAKHFLQTYLLPLADGDALCAMQFVTPNVSDSKAFSELFSAIAQTVRVFYEDTPTFEPDPAGA